MQLEECQALDEQIRDLQRPLVETAPIEAAAAVRRAVSDAIRAYSFRDRLCRADFAKLVADRVQVDPDGEMCGPTGPPSTN